MESGPVSFGDDWSGVFLRGDNAIAHSMYLGVAISLLREVDPIGAMCLEGLQSDLQSCMGKVGT